MKGFFKVNEENLENLVRGGNFFKFENFANYVKYEKSELENVVQVYSESIQESLKYMLGILKGSRVILKCSINALESPQKYSKNIFKDPRSFLEFNLIFRISLKVTKIIKFVLNKVSYLHVFGKIVNF